MRDMDIVERLWRLFPCRRGWRVCLGRKQPKGRHSGRGGMRADEYREDTRGIEISFAAPVHLSRDQTRRLVELIDEICREYEKHHPDRVMWPFGMGQKMLTNPFMVDDEHPMEFDEGVFEIECAERENYDYEPPAA